MVRETKLILPIACLVILTLIYMSCSRPFLLIPILMCVSSVALTIGDAEDATMIGNHHREERFTVRPTHFILLSHGVSFYSISQWAASPDNSHKRSLGFETQRVLRQ